MISGAHGNNGGFIFLEGRMVEWREKERKGFGDGGGAPPQESAVASGEDGEVGGGPGGARRPVEGRSGDGECANGGEEVWEELFSVVGGDA